MAMSVGMLLAVGVLVTCAPAHAYDADDTLAAIDQVSASSGVSYTRLYRIIRCETGGTFDPNSVGRMGELGAVQLYRRGELPTFYARGYDNPWNPYQAVEFLATRLLEGGAHAWTCA
jgi:hypothetical protein